MKKHPLSTSRIRSVTFNRFAAENSGTWAERARKRKYAISSSGSLKKSARTTKKREEKAEGISVQPRGEGNATRGTRLGAIWHEIREPRCCVVSEEFRNNRETRHRPILLSGYTQSVSSFFFSHFNSATTQRTRVALLPYVRSEILFEADLRCVSVLRNNGC